MGPQCCSIALLTRQKQVRQLTGSSAAVMYNLVCHSQASGLCLLFPFLSLRPLQVQQFTDSVAAATVCVLKHCAVLNPP